MNQEKEDMSHGDHVENPLPESSKDGESDKQNFEKGLESSPKDPIVNLEDKDEVESILESIDDDDEELHLKWEDDEIEEDIISLDIPPEVLKKETCYSTLDKNCDSIDNQQESNQIINKSETATSIDETNKETIQIIEPLSPEETLQDIQSEIDSICANIKDSIDDKCNLKDKTEIEINISDPSSPVDDLILIEDDDQAEVINTPEEISTEEMGEKKKKIQSEKNMNSDKFSDNNKIDTIIETEIAVKSIMDMDISDEVKDNKLLLAEDNNDKINTVLKVTDHTQNSEFEKDFTDSSTSLKICDKIMDDSIFVDDNKDSIVASSPNQAMDISLTDTKLDHGLNKPDMMLDIPTQEVIEFLDDTDEFEKTSLKNIENCIENNDTVPDSFVMETSCEVDKLQLNTSNEAEPKELEEAIEITKNLTNSLSTETNKIDASTTKSISKSADNQQTPNDKKIEEATNQNLETVESQNTSKIIAEQETEITSIIINEVQPSKSENFDSGVPTIEDLYLSAAEKDIYAENKDNYNEENATTEDVSVTTLEEPQPSTSKAVEESKQFTEAINPKDELSEVTDSLGLLAESSRVMEDDEEPEDEEEDDDDFDQDESSNQMTAEHSEDSNAQHSETDQTKEQDDKGTESPQEDKGDFSFAINDIITLLPQKDGDKKEKDENIEIDVQDKDRDDDIDVQEKDEDIDIDVQDKDGDVDIDTQDKDGDINIQEKNGDIDVDEVVCEDEVEVTAEQIGDIGANLEVNAGDNLEISEPVKEKPEDTQHSSEIETVKLSDTSDNEVEGDNVILRTMLQKPQAPLVTSNSEREEKNKSPIKKLEITKTSNNIMNFVDLEESSSEDDIQESNKEKSEPAAEEVTPVDTSTLVTEPKTPTKTKRMARINTSEISIRTVSNAEAATLPQIKPVEETPTPKFGLEVFSLDSDEEDHEKPATPEPKEEEISPVEPERVKGKKKCINLACKSAGNCAYIKADAATVAYYDATRKRKAMVCEECADVVVNRTQVLVKGIKEFTPLLELDIIRVSSELVEISDSESEDETEAVADVKEKIGEKGAKMLEEQLADMINQTWKKFKMDARLSEAEDALNKELKILEAESKEIDTLLNDCQIATDKLRNDLYATFEHERRELPPFTIFDTPTNKYSLLEPSDSAKPLKHEEIASTKRRLSDGSETPAKRAAIPLPYTPINDPQADTAAQDKSSALDSSKDDDKDIAVMQVSAEAAPSELPPPGELSRPPLRAGTYVYGMRNVFGSWVRCRIMEVQGKSSVPGSVHTFTICKVKFEGRVRNPVKLLPARCLAYNEPTDVRMTIGTRVIALFKDTNDNKRDSFYSGIIAEVPNPVNKYRYLIFFDDGYAQYVRHSDTRLVCECATLVWEEVHPFSREFVREYLMAYPERPMVRLHAGQSLKTEWNGKWWSSRVTQVDASLAQVHFEEDNRTEWIYRGSTRLAPLYLELQAAERHRARPMPRTKAQPRINMPYVEYTRSDEQNKSTEEQQTSPQQQAAERESRQRAVAKKSTTPAPAPAPPPVTPESVTSRVVYYTPKNAVKPHKMVPHTCGPQCKRTDVLALKDLRTYNPLAKPLLSGWERQIVRFKGQKEVMYRAPCGRRVRNMRELHRYLRAVQSDMAVDLFDFASTTHCLAEFVLNTCLVGKKDLSHGKENVPVPCVNYYDESLPEFCSYNTERTPTAGVPLNIDPEFLCGCDCTDDCEDKSKCACWRMTLEGARTIGLKGNNVGYVYKRLPEPLPSGIYECNSRCKCKQTCLNRVAQHPLQLKLQVFKTLNRGWGIRALNDVPKGSFLCVYAGNLLTDATANMDGLNEGDEYLAELDYIEVVEQMKEGFEEDIPEMDKRLDKKNIAKPDEEDSEEMSSSEEEDTTCDDREDDDFRPGIGIGLGVAEFSKRLRKREKKKQKEDAAKEKEKDATAKEDEDCITISDDEEVREPSSFMAQAGMESNEFKSKYRSVRSHFGKDEACYIMDAKVQGNIGRYLNHSCSPNVFVQNVFVDTHDPRFPWVAFFALCHIKAGTELTWNYNYDVGSVPGKVLYCYCGAPNCRGRLL
ncbi:unnamed protein product [Diatraea saccharalis]|uniref:Histone-lysine N-methyltransferase eggless n=1 Tax=Diatraea saccharalis TaxID=40085 RepID=A0A9P0G0R6_9NEOP|nr:unnamed protein product [Diatraea saccharalis]